MDIRTKLALAFVAVSLVSMFLLGTFAYQVSSELLADITERQLDALAESKKQDLENVIDSWKNHVRLIRSRTQLRVNLRDFQNGAGGDVRNKMRRITDDALRSTQHVERITLFDREGREVVTSGTVERQAVTALQADDGDVNYAGFYLGADGKPRVVFNSQVFLDEERIGSLEVVIDVENVESLAKNHRGQGETGETLIVGQAATGDYVLLHSLRHTDSAPDWTELPEYVRAAVSGREMLFTEGVRDYRKQAVWAATRYLPDVNWGLVEKVDAEQETRAMRGLRSDLVDLGLALGAFAVVGGTLLGLYLARPIRDIEQVLRRVREGESSLRANDQLDDEIGLLAEALNEYLDELHAAEDRKGRR